MPLPSDSRNCSIRTHYKLPKYFHTLYILHSFIGVILLQFYVILLRLYILKYKTNGGLFDVFVVS